VQTFVTVFQLPIMFLNMFGTIDAVIWLLVVGEWRWVIAGILTIIFAPFLLGLVLLPGLALSAPAVFCAKRRIMIGVYFFSFLSSIYNYGVIAAWCGGVTYYFMREVNSHSFWPLLIWSYCVATSPWDLHGTKGRRFDPFISGSIFCAGGVHCVDGCCWLRSRARNGCPIVHAGLDDRHLFSHAVSSGVEPYGNASW